jgi:hypothetical protein
VTQNEQLRSLRSVRSREARQPSKDLDHRQVQHPNPHNQIIARVNESPAHTPCDGFWHGTRADATLRPGRGRGRENRRQMGRRLRVAAQRHRPTRSRRRPRLASPPAAQTFDTLSKTQRYAAILKLVTTRTATARAAQLHRTMTALEARGA